MPRRPTPLRLAQCDRARQGHHRTWRCKLRALAIRLGRSQLRPAWAQASALPLARRQVLWLVMLSALLSALLLAMPWELPWAMSWEMPWL